MELGTPPTILQQLCNLPFKYFSDKRLMEILYPTLICCCYENEKNKSVLTTEISSDLLANYIDEKFAEEKKDSSAGLEGKQNTKNSNSKFKINYKFF